jgi:hypothetical protein
VKGRRKKEELRNKKEAAEERKSELKIENGAGKVNLRERTKDFALSVVRTFSALPKTTEAQILGRQVLRSGTSIGANYREAYRGRSKIAVLSQTIHHKTNDVVRCARMDQAQVHFLKGVSLIKRRNNFVGSPNCLAQISAR